MGRILRVYADALRRLTARAVLWMVDAAGLAALAALAYAWLAWPVARWYDLAVLALIALVWLALAAVLVWRSVKHFPAPPFSIRKLAGDAAFWAALVVTAVVGFGVPWLLLEWVPVFTSLVAQSVSLGIRALAALALVSGSLLWLLALARRLMEEEEEDDGANPAPVEREADPAAGG
jgi:hypothetical protein